jgi:uncharacterized Zn-binding protein involved in type VI secretion
MKPAARITDTHAHGGTIVTGEPTVLIGGLAAARVGDQEVCPVHGPGVIVTGSSTVIIGNSFAARLDDLCGCTAYTPGNSAEWHVAEDESHNLYGPFGVKRTSTVGGGKAVLVPGQPGEVEVFGAREKMEIYLGDPKDRGGNPAASTSIEFTGATAKAKGDILIGWDDRRTGVALFSQAGAKAGTVKVTDQRTIAFGGYSLQYGGEASVSAGSLGSTTGGGAYYDHDEERFHLLAAEKSELWFGLGLLATVSIGRKYPPGEPPPPGGTSHSGPTLKVAGGASGVPAAIKTGRANVLIG